MRLSLLLVVAGLCVTGAVQAETVTYTLTSTFTGTIGSQSFADDRGTITFQGDSSGITDLGGGFYSDIDGIGTITLDGVGTATILSPSFGASASSYSAGFFDTVTGFGLNDYNPDNPDLATYALTSPFTDTGYLLGAFGTSELTSLGDLNITGDLGSAATFTASETTAVTPEPYSILLLASGLAGACAIGRRRFGRI